jgi:hypothetical protein
MVVDCLLPGPSGCGTSSRLPQLLQHSEAHRLYVTHISDTLELATSCNMELGLTLTSDGNGTGALRWQLYTLAEDISLSPCCLPLVMPHLAMDPATTATGIVRHYSGRWAASLSCSWAGRRGGALPPSSQRTSLHGDGAFDGMAHCPVLAAAGRRSLCANKSRVAAPA